MISTDTKTKESLLVGGLKSSDEIIRITLIILLVLFLCGSYLQFAWRRYQKSATSEAIILAQSLESFIHPEHIAKLTGSAGDLDNPEYLMLKINLKRLAEMTNPIHFAYLLGQRDDSLIILVDSESPESPDYSPPGQVFTEADEICRVPFQTGRTVLTHPISDRWGRWISALVPVKDPDNGNTMAVLGIDYAASEWNTRLWVRMAPDMIIVLCVILLAIALIRSLIHRTALQRLSKKLAYNEALYRSMFEQAPIGITLVNNKNFVFETEYGDTSINPLLQKILGRSIKDLASIQWTEITHAEDLSADLERFDQFKNGMINDYTMEKRFLRPDGSYIWTNMKISQLVGVPDGHAMHLCLLEDISSRKETENMLKESERSKSVLLSHLPGLAYRCKYDHDWTMQYVSDGCYELTGYQPESLLYNKDLSYNELITPEYRELMWQEWERLITERLPFRYEYEITTADGERKWVLELGEGIFNENGAVEALEGIVIDISDRKKLENTLVYDNEHDRWTGLYNRYKLENELARDANDGTTEKFALVGINLRDTQSITSAFGFHYTQDLIKKAADKLSQYCTEQRSLFNTYWDQFVFYMREYQDKKELLDFSDIVADELETLLKAERISGGVGIIEVDNDHAFDVDLVLKKLLIASEKAMSNSEKNFTACVYDTNMELQIRREEDIKHELALIADDAGYKGLFLQYQPILDLRSNQICGFEALARINSVKLGRIPPLEFIPLAEKTKLIIPIGQKIFCQAFRFLEKLKEHGYGNIVVYINVSAIQLLKSNFVEDLLETINEMRVSPENIGLELTESVFATNYDEINDVIKTLRGACISIAIDDFGTGYSSLARERELDVDCLKIDKYFIDKLMEVQPEKAITRDIISMAHKMGHIAVAEGVEHERQKQYLLENGCDKIQGYLVSRPLDESAAIEILR